MEKITHVERIRGQYNNNTKAVLYLTGMSESMLIQFQFDTGLAWLREHAPADEETLRWILSQPQGWNWWVNQWNRRDDHHVLPALYACTEPERCEQYRAMHQAIFSKWRQVYKSLEESYNDAIANLIDAPVKLKA